ncbi:DUF1801 domain-containing protein [Devosia rhodophyticola]|uniref:DUF1801 domain-containing protein n=1 Tax=Devosia rhodophyticola TaxID=3026423 RepID=A0ABY7YV26_9HYPH|nr:DUF1801 domain-containing protein [Devosia rhodophyticola]WDR05104.1 DUF1801 domain-containing protein [Devosia rhodophyticola]
MSEAMSGDVAGVFEGFPGPVRDRLEQVRALIFEVARDTEGVGALTETLRWGEPAYLTAATKSGSTIRLGWPKDRPDCVAVYFICTTNLVATFRDIFAEALDYSGERAVLLPIEGAWAEGALRQCIGMALTYHKAKAGSGTSRVAKLIPSS